MELVYESYVPEWALCYIEYGDESGILEGEKDEIESWMGRNGLHGAVMEPDFDETMEFDRSPEFGKATSSVYCRFYK